MVPQRSQTYFQRFPSQHSLCAENPQRGLVVFVPLREIPPLYKFSVLVSRLSAIFGRQPGDSYFTSRKPLLIRYLSGAPACRTHHFPIAMTIVACFALDFFVTSAARTGNPSSFIVLASRAGMFCHIKSSFLFIFVISRLL